MGRIRALVDREAGVLSEERREELVARIAERAFGLGPLEPLLADPSVDEIMVSGLRAGLGRAARAAGGTGVRFEREADLRDAIERILAPLGRRADEAEPLCDARLPDGTPARDSRRRSPVTMSAAVRFPRSATSRSRSTATSA